MTSWSFDIIRQRPWDLWTWVCIAAAGALLMYGLLGNVRAHPRRGLVLALVASGVLGTFLVLIIPRLRSPAVGLVWTFVLLCLLSATFYLNLQAQLSRRRVTTLLSLRVAALALLVPMLFEPVVRFVAKPRPERPIAFVVDASGSMSFPDVQNGPTRLQSVWQALRGQLPAVRERLVPHVYTFADGFNELKSAEQLATLQPSGPATDIAGAVSKALAAVPQEDAIVVLLSDGIDNTSPDVVDVVGASRRPIHTVRVGSDQAEPATMANIAVDDLAAADDFVVRNETKVRATIRSTAMANRVVDVKLSRLDDEGNPVGPLTSEKLVLQPTPGGQAVELAYKPDRVGIHRLGVWVDPVAGERSTIDNRQEFQGLAIDPRVKVLYVEGRARPEYRELARALGRDPNLELATLLRIKDDRFAAGGFVDGQPLKAMPRTLEEWRKFDVVILGDLDASFLPRVQQAHVEQAVRDGLGLLMTGGQNSFGPGGYKDSPVEQALPVFAGEFAAAQEKTEFVPTLTADGAAHPAMEGLVDWFGTGTAPAKQKLPPLRGNVVVPRAKAGAQVLLVHAGRAGADGQPQIVLAAQRYGKGRSAAFTVDTTYLWYLPLRGMGQDSPYNRLWGQLVRWLAAADVRDRDRGPGVEALLDKSVFQLGQSVKVRAMVRDEKGDATRYAQVTARLAGVPASAGTSSTTDSRDFTLTPSESRTGMYEATIPNPTKGPWSVTLVATKDGKELGKRELTFTVIPPAEEMLELQANPKLLADIAQATRGYHFELSQLGQLIEQLIRQSGDVGGRQQTLPLSNYVRAVATAVGGDPGWQKKFDLPMQGMLAIVILSAEWVLRRRWQLP